MADVLMELDDDSVLRWGIADFLQRWRQTDDGDFITSGLFVLQSEDGRETRFFLQLEKLSRAKIHFRCLDETSDWTRLFVDRPLWIEREDGTKSAEKMIKVDAKPEVRFNFVTRKELAEFEQGETLTICVRFDPPAAVFPVQLQPTLFLSQYDIGYFPYSETIGDEFTRTQEVTVEKVGKFRLELKKKAEVFPDYEDDYDVDENPVVAKLILPQLPPNAQEVIVKYDLWVVDTEDENFEEEKKRTCIYGNIASFTADRKEATFEFERGLFEEFGLSSFCLLVHGYRVVPQLPPLRMDEGGPVTSHFDQKFNDAAYTDVRIVVGDRIFHYDVKLLRDLTVDHLCAKVALENVVEMLDFSLEHPALEKLRE
ncbi:hypothetical protein M3Y99_01227700 [Aphelenchoides fujianensis]|nr:hypothetical protein M3Y99_01227700 [Aphelenchoides fujianensis]